MPNSTLSKPVKLYYFEMDIIVLQLRQSAQTVGVFKNLPLRLTWIEKSNFKGAERSSGRMPAGCGEGGGSSLGWGAQEFSNLASSAETQQPVDRMRRKARGCLVLSVLC